MNEKQKDRKQEFEAAQGAGVLRSAVDHRLRTVERSATGDPRDARTNHKPLQRVPSPGGEGQDEGDLPSRVAANVPNKAESTLWILRI